MQYQVASNAHYAVLNSFQPALHSFLHRLYIINTSYLYYFVTIFIKIV